MKSIFPLSALLLGLALPSGLDAAIIIDNFSTAANDRFQDSDSPDQFIAAGFDLSGLGQDANGRWATLIGPNTILSANHFRPSGTVTFRAGNDPGLPPVQRTITSDSQRIGGTDLWVARLDDFLPAGVSPFNYATTFISQPALAGPGSSFAFQDELVFMVGRSPTAFPNTIDQAFGLNGIDGFTENDNTATSLGTFASFRLDYDPGDTAYEAFYQGGDSGAPLLWDDGNGGLTVLGVGSYITTDSNNNPVASYVNYIGNEAATVDALVAAYAAIPEVGIPLFLALSVMVPCLRRHRG